MSVRDLSPIMAALFGPGSPDTLAPARLHPAVLPLADTDRSGTLSRDEVAAALQADRITFDVATGRLVPAQPLALTDGGASETETDGAAPGSSQTGGISPAAPMTEGGASPVPRSERVAPESALTDSTVQPEAVSMARTRPSRSLTTALPRVQVPDEPVPAPARSSWPASRPPEPLMLGPRLGRAPSVAINAQGVDLTSPISQDGKLRLGMHVDTEEHKALRRGSLLLEEAHPNYLEWRNVAGSGLNLGLDSRSRLEMIGYQPGNASFSDSNQSMQASLRHEQRLHLERKFAIFGKEPDTSIQAGYLLGVGPVTFGTQGDTAVALTQYATFTVNTRPHRFVGLTGDLYLPVQDGPAGRGAQPIARFSASLPYVTLGTTQSADTSRYDASVSYRLPRGAQLAASGAVDQNRAAGTTGVTAGVQFSLPW